ncbi:polysaccharide deacetylase family protein [Clostridium sp. 19966]|uniref:polysaccharide deacetylase family protein n=1 Tax=Clostridium sp. 19966 TaxID=2768166 RepID=UPI0028F16174|nr:polysaccharide deacetylase family protein [Clostridium sp. 19966]
MIYTTKNTILFESIKALTLFENVQQLPSIAANQTQEAKPPAAKPTAPQNPVAQPPVPKVKKVAYLTFDDGPSGNVTPKMLDTLKKYGIKATFFLIGKNTVGNEAVVKRIKAEGHVIGNHSYSHDAEFPENKTPQ